MPIGLVLMRWDPKVSTDIVSKYPEELLISEETLMQIYAAHEYTAEPGMISLMVGHLNIASYFTGGDKPLYIILLLDLDDDPDAYEGGLADISRIILQNFENQAYLDMVPFLFQRLSAYPHLNLEQALALTYEDEINRLLINRLREEGVVSKSELKVWMKEKYYRGFFDIDGILIELIKKEIIKEASVKGMPSELIFLINDIFTIRRPPITLLRESVERGLPESLVEDYRSKVRSYFLSYRPSEEDNLKIIKLLTDPQLYEMLKLLRTSIVSRNTLEKLKNKGVDDIDGGIRKLLEYGIVFIFPTGQGIDLYALISDVDISLVYPRYILNTILHQYDVKSKSNGVLIEYLNVLEDTYRPYKFKEKTKEKSKAKSKD
ncbi:MAG: hypothetical protein ACFE96_17135 [Candidatus Hermodarchaeota archaeon]